MDSTNLETARPVSHDAIKALAGLYDKQHSGSLNGRHVRLYKGSDGEYQCKSFSRLTLFLDAIKEFFNVLFCFELVNNKEKLHNDLGEDLTVFEDETNHVSSFKTLTVSDINLVKSTEALKGLSTATKDKFFIKDIAVAVENAVRTILNGANGQQTYDAVLSQIVAAPAVQIEGEAENADPVAYLRSKFTGSITSNFLKFVGLKPENDNVATLRSLISLPNLQKAKETFDSFDLVVYKKADIDELESNLEAATHHLVTTVEETEIRKDELKTQIADVRKEIDAKKKSYNPIKKLRTQTLRKKLEKLEEDVKLEEEKLQTAKSAPPKLQTRLENAQEKLKTYLRGHTYDEFCKLNTNITTLLALVDPNMNTGSREAEFTSLMGSILKIGDETVLALDYAAELIAHKKEFPTEFVDFLQRQSHFAKIRTFRQYTLRPASQESYETTMRELKPRGPQGRNSPSTESIATTRTSSGLGSSFLSQAGPIVDDASSWFSFDSGAASATSSNRGSRSSSPNANGKNPKLPRVLLTFMGLKAMGDSDEILRDLIITPVIIERSYKAFTSAFKKEKIGEQEELVQEIAQLKKEHETLRAKVASTKKSPDSKRLQDLEDSIFEKSLAKSESMQKISASLETKGLTYTEFLNLYKNVNDLACLLGMHEDSEVYFTNHQYTSALKRKHLRSRETALDEAVENMSRKERLSPGFLDSLKNKMNAII